MMSEDRFMSKVSPEPNTGCWLWMGGVNARGYGFLKTGGKKILAHRRSLEAAGIALIDGMVVDHMCRQRSCVNPTHLRQVTNRENILATNSQAPARLNLNKTHCAHGHPFDEGNTYVTPRGDRLVDSRSCRICRHLRGAKWDKANAALRNARRRATKEF